MKRMSTPLIDPVDIAMSAIESLPPIGSDDITPEHLEVVGAAGRGIAEICRYIAARSAAVSFAVETGQIGRDHAGAEVQWNQALLWRCEQANTCLRLWLVPAMDSLGVDEEDLARLDEAARREAA